MSAPADFTACQAAGPPCAGEQPAALPDVPLPAPPSTTWGRGEAAGAPDELKLIDGPVVVVAHSYGGIPVSQAAAAAGNVSRIVYLTASQLDAGESLLGFAGAPVLPEPRETEAGVHAHPGRGGWAVRVLARGVL
ncbi:alpha/beta fold hydrolase [Streptomyces sp. ME18-1-4]|uniref:alpha/beta fold hydrolase n=1 Tax=Streptomyces sp. ME18-1-4 TaxID=3028685 RepID=UPI0029B68424|nr:alpha/beta fold hydrolase [Streptomyces sp. ME18-1-4]MDX3245402.1 hypothetical protein [Streptomyces sp. ME18-1-4]